MEDKIKIEDKYQASKEEIDVVGNEYNDYYKFRNYRSGQIRQLQFNSFDDYLRKSRELFWNSIFFESEDLSQLDLQLTLPFVRKEVMEFESRLVALGIKPRITGDNLDGYWIKVLNGLYQRWRFKSNDKVQKYWQSLYGSINGTVCIYVGYNNRKKKERILKQYDPKTGNANISEQMRAYWDDVETTIVPLEDIYLSKIYERDIQKQGKVIWKTQLSLADFKKEFGIYPDSQYVVPGAQISSDSLYFQLLGGTGITTTSMVEVLRSFDTEKDEYKIIANGIWLNKITQGGKVVPLPMPFTHKQMPFVWSLNEPIDEKFAYGLSLPFKIKDPHKMLNASYVMSWERELRAINAPTLSSDINSPELIYKTGKVIPVGDVNAYKQLEMAETSDKFFQSMNSLQAMMTSQAQGGSTQIIPSIQPKSSKEIAQMEQLRQQALGASLLMYYDLNRQEILLALKTMIQFYPGSKFSKEGDRIIKALMIPDMPLTQGGVGNIELRLVNESENPAKLYFEAIKKSFENKKQTEIIEAPIELLQNLEFYIKDIELEPQKSDDVEQSIWMENTLIPMLNYFVPAGLVSMEKALLRTLEKKNEAPSDWVSDQALPAVLSAYQVAPGLNRAGQAGAQAQSVVGQANGGLSNGGLGFNAGAPAQLPKV